MRECAPLFLFRVTMRAPEEFIDKLEREFRNRLRIRWSTERGEWHIEQQIRRGFFPGERPTKRGWDESIDAYVRHRDGYIHVMSVRTGDRMPCPKCGHELKVPFMQTTAIRCAYCRMIGKDPNITAVFIPLSDALITYLKKIDPENPLSEGLAERLEREDEALAQEMERKVLNPTIGAFEDDYRRIVGIPTAHLSGRTKMWLPKEAA